MPTLKTTSISGINTNNLHFYVGVDEVLAKGQARVFAAGAGVEQTHLQLAMFAIAAAAVAGRDEIEIVYDKIEQIGEDFRIVGASQATLYPGNPVSSDPTRSPKPPKTPEPA
jgi:hypothetical protein